MSHILFVIIAGLVVALVVTLSLDEYKRFEKRSGDEYSHCITKGHPESVCNQQRQDKINERNKFLNNSIHSSTCIPTTDKPQRDC